MIILTISVKPILTGETDVVGFDYEHEAPDDYDDIRFSSPVHIAGSIVNKAGYMKLTAAADVRFITHCARCTKEIERKVDIGFERVLASSLENDDENDEYLRIAGNSSVDIDGLILEDLIMNIGFIYLCREDCKGLCPKCGKDLNEGSCDCSEKKEIDPRLAILAKLLDK